MIIYKECNLDSPNKNIVIEEKGFFELFANGKVKKNGLIEAGKSNYYYADVFHSVNIFKKRRRVYLAKLYNVDEYYSLISNNFIPKKLIEPNYFLKLNYIEKFKLKWSFKKYFIQNKMFWPYFVTTIVGLASVIGSFLRA